MITPMMIDVHDDYDYFDVGAGNISIISAASTPSMYFITITIDEIFHFIISLII